jgi:hypothetical protein
MGMGDGLKFQPETPDYRPTDAKPQGRPVVPVAWMLNVES